MATSYASVRRSVIVRFVKSVSWALASLDGANVLPAILRPPAGPLLQPVQPVQPARRLNGLGDPEVQDAVQDHGLQGACPARIDLWLVWLFGRPPE